MANLRLDITGRTEVTLTRIKELTQIESLSGVLKWLVDKYGNKAILDLEDFEARLGVVSNSKPTSCPQPPALSPKPSLEPISQPGEAKNSFNSLLGSLGD